MRLIDADDALKLLRGKCVAKYPTTFSLGLFAAADELSKLPEADAVPVVHASWVDRWGGKYANPHYECSKCKKSAPYKCERDVLGKSQWVQDLTDLSHYCPNCGSKMDVGVEDG